jgi:two-component system KDP operon response regulator KdpE
VPNSSIETLVVDDELPLRRVLVTSLKASGFRVREAGNGEEALRALRETPTDLVILDINMPGLNGFETCKRIRTIDPRVGILMVTVRDSEDDKVDALESGADDFITKPFLFRELVARLRAVHRRGRNSETPKAAIYHAGELELDLEARILKKAGVEVRLSPTEFDVLAVLMQHQGVPVTHRKLLRTVWGPEYGSELEYLRSYVKMLRKKIEDDPGNPQYILTEPWAGYRFRNPSDPDAPAPEAGDD